MLISRSMLSVIVLSAAVAGGGVTAFPDDANAQFFRGIRAISGGGMFRARSFGAIRPRSTFTARPASISRPARLVQPRQISGGSLSRAVAHGGARVRGDGFGRGSGRGQGLAAISGGVHADRFRGKRGGRIVIPLPVPVPFRAPETVVIREAAPQVIRVAPRPLTSAAIVVRGPAQRLPVGGVVMATAATGMVARRVLSAGYRRDAYWDHNRSMMRLVVDQEQVKLSYEVPRPGLSSLGISRGTLLVDGRNIGGMQFAATAFTFSRQCGPTTFEVSGEATKEGDRLELRGARPIRSERCDVIRHEEETLEFVLMALRPDLPRDVTAPLLPVDTGAPSIGSAVTLDAAVGRPAAEQMPGSRVGEPVWTHNGTAMRVEVEDKTVRFYAEAAQEGEAARQKPMFEGMNVTDKVYAGSAYAYSRQCGDVPYRVQGTVAPDGGRLELTGLRPELDDKCSVAGQRQETLVFELK